MSLDDIDELASQVELNHNSYTTQIFLCVYAIHLPPLSQHFEAHFDQNMLTFHVWPKPH